MRFTVRLSHHISCLSQNQPEQHTCMFLDPYARLSYRILPGEHQHLFWPTAPWPHRAWVSIQILVYACGYVHIKTGIERFSLLLDIIS